jgi:hypothetical protein
VRDGKTLGGLMIMPEVQLIDPSELSTYVAPTSTPPIKRSLPGEPDLDFDEDPGYNPLDEYKDSMFNHPYDIAFNFFDPSKSLSTPDEIGRLKYHRTPPDVVIDIDTLQSDNFEDKVFDNNLETSIKLGLSKEDPTHVNYEPMSTTLHTSEQINGLFGDLAKKAAVNIANGTVSKEDITDLAHRDIGVYSGNELTKVNPFGFGGKLEKAAENMKRQNIVPKIIDDIASMHTDESMTMSKIFEKHVPNRLSTAEKEVKLTAIMSTILHGIGAKDFLPTFLDSYKNVMTQPKTTTDGNEVAQSHDGVNEFLGKKRPMDTELLSRAARSIRTNSPYYKPLIQNHYKSLCR